MVRSTLEQKNRRKNSLLYSKTITTETECLVFRVSKGSLDREVMYNIQVSASNSFSTTFSVNVSPGKFLNLLMLASKGFSIESYLPMKTQDIFR